MRSTKKEDIKLLSRPQKKTFILQTFAGMLEPLETRVSSLATVLTKLGNRVSIQLEDDQYFLTTSEDESLRVKEICLQNHFDLLEESASAVHA